MALQQVCPESNCKEVLRPLYFRPKGTRTYKPAKGYGWCSEHGPQGKQP